MADILDKKIPTVDAEYLWSKKSFDDDDDQPEEDVHDAERREQIIKEALAKYEDREAVRVNNVMSSTAGAGSGEFHSYRHQRRKEMIRIGKMEKSHLEAKLDEEYRAEREAKQAREEEKTNKKAEKRRKRKQKMLEAKKRRQLDASIPKEETAGEELEASGSAEKESEQ